VGVDLAAVLPALAAFRGIKRRLEVVGTHDGITVYDDFAPHPPALATTLAGLRARVGGSRIVVAMEPRSNSMRLGAHADALAPALDGADLVVFLHRPELAWDAGKVVAALRHEGRAVPAAATSAPPLRKRAPPGHHVLSLSNAASPPPPAPSLPPLSAAGKTD